MNKHYLTYPEQGKQSKLIRIEDGVLKTLGKDFNVDKIHAYASNSDVTADYLLGFASSHQSYEFEKDALDEYPDQLQRIVQLKQRTQAFMHSAINARAIPTSVTGRAIEREMKKLPRHLRKMLTIHTSRQVALNEFENIKFGFEATTILFVSNGIVFRVYYRSQHEWEARAENAIVGLSNSSLRDLLYSCEHLALYSEVI